MSVINEVEKLIYEIGELRNDNDAKKRLNTFFKGQELHQITKNFRDYRKKEKGKISKEYNTKLQQYILLIEFYLDVGRYIKDYWKKSDSKNETEYRINTSFKLFYKSVQTVIDILTLFESGSLTACLPLWRMIYENYVITLFLLKNNENKSIRFNDHEPVDEYIILKAMTKSKIKGEKIIEELKNKYGSHFTHPFGWTYENGEKALNSFSHIRNAVGEEEFYEFYKFASTLLHSSSLSVNRSMFSDGKRGNTGMVGSFHKNLELPYELTVRIMKAYVDSLIDFFYEVEDTDGIIIKDVNGILMNFVLGNGK